MALMNKPEFEAAFAAVADNPPFPWQWALYQQFLAGNFPTLCLPTGLGKTAVIHIWLLALAYAPTQVPRRWVYVVNRRTVVDQSTEEARKLRNRLANVPDVMARLCELCAEPTDIPLAISTLRGQFADNREWSSDPARPAVIAGTVDMIGSRLLFSGYGCGFKSRPLHAGFLGQDALLVHDEAHLEPAFQNLLIAIRKEQERCKEFKTFRVMELSATSRSGGEVFELTKEERELPGVIPKPPIEPIHHVWRRQKAKKTVRLHKNKDEKKLADEIAELALKHQDSGRAVLIFVRKVDDVDKVVKKLPKGSFEQLTGTLRGLERDGLVKKPIFQQFLPESDRDKEVTHLPPGPWIQGQLFLPESDREKDATPAQGTVYLVCTSAGEVGVNISADHLVCDLSTFDSMAQRFGRVNRFGDRDDTCIDIVYPKEFDEKDAYDSRLKKTLDLLHQLNGDGSPAALGKFDANIRLDAFAPEPETLSTSDILFDSWALTTIRGKLPGRPPVEPYLHGLASELPETYVAWREEVWELQFTFKNEDEGKEPEAEERKRLGRFATELLDDYPLKPHELLRDTSSRIFDRLRKLKAPAETPVWIAEDDDSVTVTTLGELIDAGKDDLNYKTVLLPPNAGGLEKGMLTSDSKSANDVADHLRNEAGEQRRLRVWDKDAVPDGMRLIRTIDTKPDANEGEEEGSTGRRLWRWFELAKAGDGEGSQSGEKPVRWRVHTCDVVKKATELVAKLPLSDDVKRAVILAARFHDLGKRRKLWQRSIGHKIPNDPQPDDWLAKSGGKMQLPKFKTEYRHEFGSLLDIETEPDFLAIPDEDLKDLVRHLIAVHHGRGRPHFSVDEAFDLERLEATAEAVAREVPQRFARLQRKYGRWGLAYLESLLRAADHAASARPSAFVEEGQ